MIHAGPQGTASSELWIGHMTRMPRPLKAVESRGKWMVGCHGNNVKSQLECHLLCAVSMDIEDSSPAMSYSKNPNNRKSKKSGFFKKVFK